MKNGLIILLLLSLFSCKQENEMVKKEQFIKVENGLNLWVEMFGNKDDEACLFISGAGANSSFWSDKLCNSLVEKGFFVIKYDHRDFGYSSKIDFNKNPYDVMRLAKDALTVMDSLSVEKAHVVGHSMGGFIVQLLGIHYPDRVLSITSASSSTSSPSVPMPPKETWQIFMSSSPINNYKKDLNGFMKVWEYLNGTANFDKELAIEYTKNLYERQDITGALGENHVKAQANLYDRSEELKKIYISALILHGEEDYLVDKYGGIQTAECIRNSELVLIPKMGHIPFNYTTLEMFENEIIKFISKNKYR